MPKDATPKGLEAFLNAPLARTLWNRRTKRVSRGSNVVAGSLSWKSQNDRAPLSPLQEAILIAATGASGMTMPDRPFFDDESGDPIAAILKTSG